jgi:hypothetical protein
MLIQMLGLFGVKWNIVRLLKMKNYEGYGRNISTGPTSALRCWEYQRKISLNITCLPAGMRTSETFWIRTTTYESCVSYEVSGMQRGLKKTEASPLAITLACIYLWTTQYYFYVTSMMDATSSSEKTVIFTTSIWRDAQRISHWIWTAVEPFSFHIKKMFRTKLLIRLIIYSHTQLEMRNYCSNLCS